MCPPSTRNPGNHAPSTLGQLRKRPDSDTDTFQISMRMKQRKRLAPEAKQLVGNFLKHKKKLKTATCSVHGRRTRFSSLFAFKNYIHCDHNILCKSNLNCSSHIPVFCEPMILPFLISLIGVLFKEVINLTLVRD